MLVKIKVFPQSSKNKITQKSEDFFEVRIREKPRQGLANKVIIKMFSDFFKDKKIRIIKGQRQRNKILEIR